MYKRERKRFILLISFLTYHWIQQIKNTNKPFYYKTINYKNKFSHKKYFSNHMYSTIIKQLDASRRLQEELKLQRHHQSIEKQRIDIQLQALRRSRKQFIDSQLQSSSKEYSQKLNQDPQVTKEHLDRQKKAQVQRSKIAQGDFQKQRDQLLRERNNYDSLDRDYTMLDRAILDLQNRSRLAHDKEERRIIQLEIRRKQVVKLLNESKDRELVHYERSKQLAVGV